MRIAKLFLLIAFSLSACAEEDPEDTATPESRELDFTATVHFLDSETDTVMSIRASVADDERSRTAGLMDVHDLPQDRGMFFIFEDEEPRSFWMANTPLPLDIIFVNSEGEIVRIHQNTRPYSDRSVESDQPAMYAVEVNAGFAIRHDIREGMRISYER